MEIWRRIRLFPVKIGSMNKVALQENIRRCSGSENPSTTKGGTHLLECNDRDPIGPHSKSDFQTLL